MLVLSSPSINEHVIGIEVPVRWVQSLVEDVLVRIKAVRAFSLDDDWQVFTVTLSSTNGIIEMSIKVDLVWHVFWRGTMWATS
jgi:hypothetical protein